MTTELIAMASAGLGVIFSIVYLFLAVLAIKTLRDVRDRLEHR
jgi:hypothetical protein